MTSFFASRMRPGTCAALVLLVVIVSFAGCGSGSLRDTCDSIEWKGRQCQALKRVDWAKAHGIPPNTVEGYYSLPEDAR